MASILQRLGAFSYRRRRLVLATWLSVLVAVGAAAALGGATFVSSFSVPGTESQDANDLLQERLPAAAGGSARVVFAAPEGERLDRADRAAITDAVTSIGAVGHVAQATDPFETRTVSQDGRIAFTQVSFDVPVGEITTADRDVIAEAAETARDRGLEVAVGGDAAEQAPAAAATEAIGVVVALVVLAITFGSLLAAGMPLLTAMIGVGTGLAGVTAVAALTELSSAVLSLGAMLGLAVGIDYALFIVSRHRGQVQDGMRLPASVAHAVGTAGSAVVFAGATVVIALVALAVTGVPFLTAMGLAAAATVVIAVLVAITLVPALLGFAGMRAVGGKRFESTTHAPRTRGAAWVALVVRHRVPAVALVVLATLAMAIPVTHIRLGLPDDSWGEPDDGKRQTYDLIAEGFGPGFSGPLTVVTELPAGTDAKAVGERLQGDLSALDDVATVVPAGTSPDGTVAITTVIPASGPSTAATKDLVQRIRDDVEPAVKADTGATVAVTGQTAVNIDVADKMSGALIPYLAVVVGLAFVLLMIAFRSLLVPLIAVAGFLLTILAALGAMVGVFQDGFALSLLGVSAGQPVVSLIPILMIGILFGLAMDYQVFLVSRMREAHAHGADPQDAVRDGFRQSGRVVTAAALIMVSVFAGFVLAHDPIVKGIGFGLAVGVLVDAFLVRMTLIPALMSLLGERAWWLPRRLDRLIPDVDLEGTSLTTEPEERREPVAA